MNDDTRKSLPWVEVGSEIHPSLWEAKAISKIFDAHEFQDPIGLIKSTGADVRHFFEYCHFEGIDFSGSSVEGVSFFGAILDGCTFTADQWASIKKTGPATKESSIKIISSVSLTDEMIEMYESIRQDCTNAMRWITKLLEEQTPSAGLSNSARQVRNVLQTSKPEIFFVIGLLDECKLEARRHEVRLVTPRAEIVPGKHLIEIKFPSTQEVEVFEVALKRDEVSDQEYFVVTGLLWNDLDGTVAIVSSSDVEVGAGYVPRLIERVE